MRDSAKSESACTLSLFMDETFKEITRTDYQFGKVLQKWKCLFHSTVKKIALVRGSQDIDIFQDLMVTLSKVNSMYPVKLYRYKRKIYELDRIDGFNVRLIKSRYNVRKMRVIWARKERVKLVKKASLSALIYRKIQQQSSVILRSVFTQKNGYVVISTEDGYVRMRNGEYGQNYQSIRKRNVIKLHDEVSLDSPIGDGTEATLRDVMADTKNASSEKEYQRIELVTKIFDRLSKPAQLVFKWNLMNPSVSDRETLKSLNLSKKRLNFARREIIQNYLIVTKQQSKSVCAPYVIFNGNYYYLVDEDGEYIIIRGGLQKRYVHKNKVKIEYELAYRTPIHLSASMVA